jgi:hypothetical protein
MNLLSIFSSDEPDSSEEYEEEPSGKEVSKKDEIIIEEQREVIRNQLEILKHHQNISSAILRTSATIVLIIIGSVISVGILRRDTFSETLSEVISGTQTTLARDFIYIGLAFLGWYLLILVLQILSTATSSLRVLGEREEWDFRTVEDNVEDIKQRQRKLIESNEESIKRTEFLVTKYTKEIGWLISGFVLTAFLIFSTYVLSVEETIEPKTGRIAGVIIALLGPAIYVLYRRNRKK